MSFSAVSIIASDEIVFSLMVDFLIAKCAVALELTEAIYGVPCTHSLRDVSRLARATIA